MSETPETDDEIRERGTPRRTEGFFVTHHIEQRDQAIRERDEARAEAEHWRDNWNCARETDVPNTLPWEDQPDEER